MNEVSMSSSRPYLVRALNEWIVDNGLTPYIVCNAGYPGVEVPQHYVENGKIVLNISPQAVQGLSMNNDETTFSARFGGVETFVRVPMLAIMAIYARENGQGMVFVDEGGQPPPEPEPEPRKPSLKLVT